MLACPCPLHSYVKGGINKVDESFELRRSREADPLQYQFEKALSLVKTLKFPGSQAFAIRFKRILLLQIRVLIFP